MRKFIALACLVTLVATAAEPSTHLFEIRPVFDAASVETERITFGPHQVVVNVGKNVLLDESALKSVKAGKDKNGYAKMDLTFTPDGAKRFATVTQQNIGKQVALLIKGRVYSAPVIASAITNGKAQIVGLGSLDEAISKR